MAGRLMIMAGGTGGHVFPALAVAREMQFRGWDVFWLGTDNSFESRVIPEQGIDMEWISIQGLRGKGLGQLLKAPFRLMLAMWQAMRVILRKKPDVVLGMGGFVSGPGGIVSRIMGKPLVIQEQNAIPGMTNRWLAKVASRVFEAFPGSFPDSIGATVSGNPVRTEIKALDVPATRFLHRKKPVHLLVIGGSLGAQVLNETVPQALADFPEELRPQVRHQSGRGKVEETLAAYRLAGVSADVSEFFDDMAEVYNWADFVVCRSGALTVSELSAVGIGALLVPFPYAVDDHQTRNAEYLVNAGAAVLMQQSDMTARQLSVVLQQNLFDRERLLSMAEASRALAETGAAAMIATACEELVS